MQGLASGIGHVYRSDLTISLLHPEHDSLALVWTLPPGRWAYPHLDLIFDALMVGRATTAAAGVQIGLIGFYVA